MNDVIFCGFGRGALDERGLEVLVQGTRGWELVFAAHGGWSNLAAVDDPRMAEATVIFGQPEPAELDGAGLRWVHLTSAGYGRYDKDDVRRTLAVRGVRVTTSSQVYAEPCAEHLLAMMLAMSRRLPELWRDQEQRVWLDLERRAESSLLVGQSVLLLGFGAIAKRLCELLAPFRMNVTALRRQARGNEGVPVITAETLATVLPHADHVVSMLPGNDATARFVSAERIALMKKGALFYNVGRGSTVDQVALAAALNAKLIGGAYLDVTDPEPLPPGDALWSAPRCYITPHTAGGQAGERLALMRHFVANLDRFAAGEALLDRVI